MSEASFILIAVAAPFVAALLSIVAPRRLAEVWSYPAAAIALVCSLLLLPGARAGGGAAVSLLEILPGLELRFRADALGVTFAVLASGLWVLAALYSSGYVRADHLRHRPRYFACFAASVGAAVAVALSANLLTFLLFYELLTLMTYPLVVHKQTPAAISAGRRYLAFALTAGLVLTVATVWIWRAAGTVEFTAGGFLAGHLAPAAMTALFVMLLGGCAVKAAIMPLHSWLPAAMVAPSPVSALLHAVAVVKAGVFGCMRMIGFVFGPEVLAGTAPLQILAALCAATILIGSLLALRQDNLKRRLAYSTVVHLSYIVLGAAMLAPHALTGSVLHMVNHGLAKITLFFCAGAIYGTTHLENISHMKGLGRRMPWTFAAFTVASLALIGVPGLCGFVGKLFLARGALQADQLVYLALLLGASLFSAAYLLPIIRTAYFETADKAAQHGPDEHQAYGEATPALVLPLLGTAVLVFIFGMFPAALGIQHELASQVSQQVFAPAAGAVGPAAALADLAVTEGVMP
jgi:multicomponent Na+:H+ antiporter subunit D